mmetsp:Transcript_2235/g.7781  ORF Transcript_2235/g.7781 Transcript_2235/m.7781 type:complete len:227 (-) Transcript_2235:625-1305(-)
MRVFFPEQSLHGIQLVFGTSARVCVVGCVSVGTIVSIAKPNFRVSVTVHRGCGRGVDTHVTRNSTLFVCNECASLPLNLRHAPQAGDQLQGRSFRGRGRRVWRVGFVGCPTPRRDRRQPAPRLRRRLSLLGLPAKRVDLPERRRFPPERVVVVVQGERPHRVWCGKGTPPFPRCADVCSSNSDRSDSYPNADDGAVREDEKRHRVRKHRGTGHRDARASGDACLVS